MSSLLRRSRRAPTAALGIIIGAFVSLHAAGCTTKKTHLPFVVPLAPTEIVSGDVVLFYTVTDVKDASVQAVFDVSRDGGQTYIGHATPAQGQPPAPVVLGHPFGAPNFFFWNSLADLGPGLHRNVVIRAIGGSGGTSGRPVLTTPFIVDNSDIFVRPSTGATLARSNVVAVPLPNGTVYVAGGALPGGGFTATGEVYDPVTVSVTGS
jgi:hypothetical protein